MIAAILVMAVAATPAVAAATSSVRTAITFENVPQEVVRVSAHDWHDADAPVRIAAEVEMQGRRMTVRAEPDRRTLLRLERADGAYLLDGPFWWPAHDAMRVLDGRWRRTVAVGSAEPIPGVADFAWVSAVAQGAGEWPRCFQTGGLWTCWGVIAGEAGVLVCHAGDRVWWTTVARVAAPALRSSRWGRLLVVPDLDGDAAGLRVRFAHPVSPSSQRVAGVRLETAAVARAQATTVAPGVVWLSGEDVPPDAWVEVRTIHVGPAYLPLEEVAGGSSSLPLTLRLDETRALDGLAVGPREERASLALITVFRLIDPPSRSSSGASQKKPRRVLVTETIADADGAFHIDGAGDADYEVVAWHPQLGRAVSPLPRRPGVFIVRLESPGTVRGRVLAAGKPLAGVDVISLPGPEAFMIAEDPVELKGGDARTRQDGRFAVMLAAGGGGELRVGGGTHPIKRIPLPREPAPFLDLGDIDLGSLLEITILLDQETACDVRATGPIGQSGLQIVAGTRTAPGLFRMVLPELGLWAFALLCGRDERVLSPETIQITPAHAGKEVRFSVR